MREAVIVSAVRTPLGSFNGSLGNIGATRLGAIVIEEAVKRAGIEKKTVNEVIMGIVLPCGYGQNPAKQAAVKADMPWEVECITVNKVCGSALKSSMTACGILSMIFIWAFPMIFAPKSTVSVERIRINMLLNPIAEPWNRSIPENLMMKLYR